MFPNGSRPDLPFCRTILHWRDALIKTHQVSDLPGAMGKSNRGKKTSFSHNLNKIHLHHQKKRYNTKTPLPTCPFPSPHKGFKAVATQALRFWNLQNSWTRYWEGLRVWPQALPLKWVFWIQALEVAFCFDACFSLRFPGYQEKVPPLLFPG